MSIETAHDPRTALVKTKYFSLHPKPLERWLWKQALPPAAERVFWLHWEAGMQNGDWCSEIPLKRVAFECCVDPSTVTRAYQLLKALELIRREDPGRDPNNPFQQATAITEVKLPRELIAELASSPNRPEKPAQFPREPSPIRAIQPPATAPGKARLSRGASQALWSRASAAERSRYFVASRDRLTSFEFDANTQLSPEDRGEILSQLAQVAAARPAPSQSKTSPGVASAAAGPRRLSVLELARVRRRIQELTPAAGSPEVLRQVIWAVEEGALRRFTVSLAINIALKKIREGAWSKPHRMPPNWLPRMLKLERAQPEPCTAA